MENCYIQLIMKMDGNKYSIFIIFIILISGCTIDDELSEDDIQKLFKSRTLYERSKLNSDSLHTYEISAFKLKNPSSNYNGLELVIVKVDKPKMKVRFVNIEGNRDSIYSIFSDSNSIVTVNGGYFGYNHKKTLIPLGLEIDDSIQKSSFTPWKIGGVIYDVDSVIAISPISYFNKEAKYNNALQSKPIVVFDGKSEIYSKSLKWRNRTAVGVDKDGTTVIVGVFNSGTGALSLYDFAKIISYKTNEKPLAEIALAMDGGKSSYIYIPKLKRSWGNKTPLYVQNVVLFNK